MLSPVYGISGNDRENHAEKTGAGNTKRTGIKKSLSAVFVLITVIAVSVSVSANPLPPDPPEPKMSVPGVAGYHYALAIKAVGQGDCETMREQLSNAAGLGYPVDPALAREWGMRCGATVEDVVDYSMKLTRIAVSGSGTTAATATVAGQVFIIDLTGMNDPENWQTGMADIKALDVSSSGALLVAAGDRKVVVRHSRGGNGVFEKEYESFISSVRFSRDGRLLAIGQNRMEPGMDGERQIEGAIKLVSLADTSKVVEMKGVPGNPVALAVTEDNEKVVAFCWPRDYSFNTVAYLCTWDAGSGALESKKEVRTTTTFPASISRDGTVLAYSRIYEHVLLQNKSSLDRSGKVKDSTDMASSSWLRDKNNFRATALDVIEGDEAPLVSGREVIGVDDGGEWAAVRDEKGNIFVEGIGEGSFYKAEIEKAGIKVATDLPAGFGGGGCVLLVGLDNLDMMRFGWLPTEMPKTIRTAEAK